MVARPERRYYALRAVSTPGFMVPVLTLFLVENDVSYATLGLAGAVTAAVVVLAEVPTGYVSDRVGRRATIATSQALFAATPLVLVTWPNRPGTLAGFAILGLAETLQSGAVSAWCYDALDAAGRADEYTAVAGRGSAIRFATLAATAVLGGLMYAVHPTHPIYAAAIMGTLGIGFALSLSPTGEETHRKRGESAADDTEADDPAADDTEANDPGPTNPEADDPGPTNPEADDPGPTNPEADDSGATNPEADDSGATNPEADDSGATNPEADDPGPTNPEADDSGATDPLGPREALVIVREYLWRPEVRWFLVIVAGVFAVGRSVKAFVQPVAVDGLEPLLAGVSVAGYPVPETAVLGVAYAGFAVAASVASEHANAIAARLGTARTVLAVTLIDGVVLLAVFAGPILVIPVMFVHRGAVSVLVPVKNAYLHEHVEGVGRATVLSATSLVVGLAKIPVTTASGVLGDVAGPTVAIAALGGFVLLVTIAVHAVATPVLTPTTEPAPAD
jgi:MFS family permease